MLCAYAIRYCITSWSCYQCRNLHLRYLLSAAVMITLRSIFSCLRMRTAHARPGLYSLHFSSCLAWRGVAWRRCDGKENGELRSQLNVFALEITAGSIDSW